MRGLKAEPLNPPLREECVTGNWSNDLAERKPVLFLWSPALTQKNDSRAVTVNSCESMMTRLIDTHYLDSRILERSIIRPFRLTIQRREFRNSDTCNSALDHNDGSLQTRLMDLI